MRLTKYHREAFVRSVLSDTPKVNYQDLKREVIQDHLISIAPPEVINVYTDKKLKLYLAQDHVKYTNNAHYGTSWGLGKFWLVPEPQDGSTYEIKHQATLNQLIEYDRLECQQIADRKALEDKLNGVIAGFSTLKKAKDALPEFAKYLPEDEEKSPAYLPAIDGLVTDLVKMGWPDGGKPVEGVSNAVPA